MKKMRIAAVLTALLLMTSVCMTGCKSDETSGNGSDSSSSSDSGLSLSIDTNITTTSPYVQMSFEDNYDAAAIAEMNKIVSIHGMQFTALDYNFYFANEYSQLLGMSMQGGSYGIPMTEAGFIDMEGQLTEKYTVKQYLNEIVISDFQGEVYLLEYAQSKNLQLDETVLSSIDEQFKETEETAKKYGMTLDEYLQSYYGPEATEEGLRAIMQRYELVNLGMQNYVKEYQFKEGEDMLPIVYHVLYPTIDLNTTLELTEEAQAEAKKKAEDMQASITSLEDMKTKGEAAVQAGEAAEANQYTVMLGQMVQEFEDWCFAKHEVGDTGVVKTMYGYHVMYYVGQEPAGDSQKQQIAYKQLQAEMEEAVKSGNYDPVYS
ncbi:MAG: peptidylprolyl isomerase [Clostridiales bacterium]|nr:peptidylprolyl isomerase [Clostridiales bacterium]